MFWPLFIIGLFSALSFTAVNFGYKLLPIGLVAAVLSMKVFFSLWLSKKKYKEKNLLPKVLASIVAFGGVLLLVL